MAGYAVRAPRDIEEFGQLAAVFQEVFSLADRATPPAWLMEDSTKAGGLTLGLWHGGQAVGFSYAFAGIDAAGPYLYSSGLGVLPAHRSQGRAQAMKVAQAQMALERGYRRIRWTYSALRSVNAHLYLTRLGGVGREYLVDTRGSLDSDWVTEGGIPLDEFSVDWDLESERVRSRLDGPAPAGLGAGQCITRCRGAASARVLKEIDGAPSAGRVVCEIPGDFQSLVTRSPELARDWRMKTRPAFAALMEAGYLLTECIREAGRQVPYYVFEKVRDGNA